MFLRCFQNGPENLLAKRFVFDGPVTGNPEAQTLRPPETTPPTPEAQREQLRQQPVAELQAQLEAMRVDLRARIERARALVAQLASKNEQEQASLANEIKAMLNSIEQQKVGQTELGREFADQTYQLRIEVARNMKSMMEKITWSMPSVEGIQVAFQGDGSFLHLARTIPLLITHVKNLLYVFGFAGNTGPQVVRTGPQTSPPPPGTLETRRREQLPPVILGLGTITNIGLPTGDPEYLVFRSQTVAGATQVEWRIDHDGNNLQKKNPQGAYENVTQGKPLFIAEYLQGHKDNVNFLAEKVRGADNEKQTRTKIASALIKLQIAENQRGDDKVDVVNYLKDNWDLFANPQTGLAKNLNLTQEEIKDMMINNPSRILAVIRQRRSQEFVDVQQFQETLVAKVSSVSSFMVERLGSTARMNNAETEIRNGADQLIQNIRNTRSKTDAIQAARQGIDAILQGLETQISALGGFYQGKRGELAFGDKLSEVQQRLRAERESINT